MNPFEKSWSGLPLSSPRSIPFIQAISPQLKERLTVILTNEQDLRTIQLAAPYSMRSKVLLLANPYEYEEDLNTSNKVKPIPSSNQISDLTVGSGLNLVLHSQSSNPTGNKVYSVISSTRHNENQMPIECETTTIQPDEGGRSLRLKDIKML